MMSTTHLILIGEGEPLLHRRLFDMISLAKKAGLRVELLTNGTMLDETSCNSLIDSGLDRLKVSLWATSQEEYAQNYRGTDPACFGRAVDGLSRLGSLKAQRNCVLPRVILHQPINRHNFRRVDAVVALAKTTGCNEVSFSPFKTWNGRFADQALSTEQEGSLRRSLKRMRRDLRSLSMGHNIDTTLRRYQFGDAVWKKLPCYIAWQHVRIQVDGTVLPCKACEKPLGSLHDNTLREIWNGPGLRSFRRAVMTRRGLAGMGGQCDCGFCCHVSDNLRVHHVFRWLAPFSIRGRSRTEPAKHVLNA
jgi:MoaA/NifB/PqqE/SkfB family radical SAM enzyme